MKLKWEKLTGVLGIIFVIIGILGILFWEYRGEKLLLYKDVFIVNNDVKKGTLITKDVISTMKFRDTQLINGAILFSNKRTTDESNLKDIINKSAKQFIPKNSQLSKRFVDNTDVILKDNQFIFKVPNEWIVAIPSSLRRRDKIFFYSVSPYFQEKYSFITETEIEDIKNINDIKNNDILQEIDQIPILSFTVAYVKDSANREVINVGENYRFDGSSQVSNIEIIADIKQIDTLVNYFNEGFKFLLLYKD